MKSNNTCVVWHAHHECDFPLEFLNESFAYHIRTIRNVKSSFESSPKIKAAS